MRNQTPEIGNRRTTGLFTFALALILVVGSTGCRTASPVLRANGGPRTPQLVFHPAFTGRPLVSGVREPWPVYRHYAQEYEETSFVIQFRDTGFSPYFRGGFGSGQTSTRRVQEIRQGYQRK